ncbi:MAG: hypothetical protein AAFQ71_14670 [Planctomycetota bacterium]
MEQGLGARQKFTRGSGSERTCGSRSAAAAHRWYAASTFGL